jgi:hypothetical protein
VYRSRPISETGPEFARATIAKATNSIHRQLRSTMQSGAEGQPLEMLGMAEESMLAYAESLIEDQARISADERGVSLEEELGTPGFAAARSALHYVVKVMVANNAYLTNHLLELGVIRSGDGLRLADEER